jgi:hypothetical protein
LKLRCEVVIEVLLLDNGFQKVVVLSLHHLEELLFKSRDVLERDSIQISACPCKDTDDLPLDGHRHKLSLLQQLHEVRAAREKCLCGLVEV